MNRSRLLAAAFAAVLGASPSFAQSDAASEPETAIPDSTSVDRSRFSGRPVDAAYGAYQRGYYITALNLATPLALDGDAAAQTLIAEIYSRGLGVRQDTVKAMEWYEKAVERKVPEAQFQLAMILLDGGAEFGDENRAYRLMEDAANAGHKMAQFNFAQMVVDRQPTPSGIGRAVSYYEKAAEAGLADAQYAMAEVMREGVGGKTADLAAARRWLELAARQNYDTAQVEFGTWLVEGVGGDRDQEAGFGWLLRAATAGNPAAQTRVAKLYRAGVGVEHDAITAAAWYLRARRAGLVDSTMEDYLHGLTDEQMRQAAERAGTLG